MNRSQIMALVLIVALVGNTFLHFLHPAYREYQRLGEELNSQVETFRKDITKSFVPVVSNIVNLLQRAPYASVAPDDMSYAVKTSMPLVVGSRFQETTQLSYAHCGDTDYVVLNGSLALTLGDDLFGYPIRRITPTSVTTDTTTYLFAPSVVVANKDVNHDNK